MSLSLLLSTILLGYPLIFMPSYISEGNSFPKPLSAKEEAEYIKKLEDGDPSARNVLVEHNLRLVAHRQEILQYGNRSRRYHFHRHHRSDEIHRDF